jgi:hypothetical protein
MPIMLQRHRLDEIVIGLPISADCDDEYSQRLRRRRTTKEYSLHIDVDGKFAQRISVEVVLVIFNLVKYLGPAMVS